VSKTVARQKCDLRAHRGKKGGRGRNSRPEVVQHEPKDEGKCEGKGVRNSRTPKVRPERARVQKGETMGRGRLHTHVLNGQNRRT
jgi:hypothetical protein